MLLRRSVMHRRARAAPSSLGEGATDLAPACRSTERPLLNNLSEQIRECLQHADDCARRAAEQTCPTLKEDFLDLERRWLSLARSYEFCDRLDDFTAETKRRAGDLAKPAHAQ
jgi:hypothetical protein